MAIQDLPVFFDMIYCTADGRLTTDSYLYNDQTFQALNLLVILVNSITSTVVDKGNVTINGINPPSFTTTQINTFFNDASIPIGTLWYNSNMDKLQFKGASAVQTITSV